MSPNENAHRSFQEVIDLIKLPAEEGQEANNNNVRRFMGVRSGWLPGDGLLRFINPGGPTRESATYGGHVYCGSAWAACRTWRELEGGLRNNKKSPTPSQRFGIHTIHGYFTDGGIWNRPIIYDVTPITSSYGFSTLAVTARQPSVPSTNLEGDHFAPADAALPLRDPCFTALVSFKRSSPHNAGQSLQEPPPQTRFADVLASRAPHEWAPSPPLDNDAVVAAVGPERASPSFPALEIRKVDMHAFNDGKPLHERRELLLYRLLHPLPSDVDGDDGDGSNGEGQGEGRWDANAHVLAHAYGADRNSMLMLSNHLGIGFRLRHTASLSYSFVVHTNADDAVMRSGEEEGWWVQETSFIRGAAQRGLMQCKIWSPEGVHVATGYQDGVTKGWEKKGVQKDSASRL